MHKGYILDLDKWANSLNSVESGRYWVNSRNLTSSISKKNKVIISKYEKSNGHLSAKQIMDDLFPTFKADVFLSHSHKDLSNVLIFAGYLIERGYRPFIDSFVWGNAYDLLKKVNNMYSRNEYYGYKYKGVVDNAKHIYMMLNSSLIRMIDKTDKFILLETPQTIQRGNTLSPWVYSELLYSQILCPDEILNEDHMAHSIMASLQVDYTAYTDHLEKLDTRKLEHAFVRRKPVYGGGR